MRATLGFLILVALQGCSLPIARSGSTVSLDSWTQLGNAEWTINTTGAGAGPGERTGYLVSTQRYRDFTLIVDFSIDDATNSGIFVRCINPRNINPDDCYEVNIWDNHPVQDFRTGSIVKRMAPIARVDTLERWNRMRIEARGSALTVTVNDIVTARLDDDDLREGHIALQYGGTGAIDFRNLRLDEHGD